MNVTSLPAGDAIDPEKKHRHEVKDELQAFVDAHFQDARGLRVLEAGCGSAGHVRLPAGSRVVGIDLSEKQLERNTTLDEKILGDLQTYELPARSFDMIICWDVLEHLPHPERALKRFFTAIRDEGIIVLAMPNVMSLKGQVTKWTPHAFHVWFYRSILGRKDAGKDDQNPFRTYLRFSIAPDALERFATHHGLSTEFIRLYESIPQERMRHRLGLVGGFWWLVRTLVRGLTLGRIDAASSDYVICLTRQATLRRA